MAEIASTDNPSVAKPVSRPRSRKSATVSASALALHLDCSRAYIGKLEAEGVIQWQGDSFPLDQSRVAYLRYLRRERKQSPRSEADSQFILAKAELLQLRIQERKGALIPVEDAAYRMEKLTGVFLTGLSSFPAMIAGRDLVQRRAVEKAVFNLRTEISETLNKLGAEEDEKESPNDT